MIEFQLTVYMCSHCTRVHNAAHECLRHEVEEHATKDTSDTNVVVAVPNSEYIGEIDDPVEPSSTFEPFTTDNDVKPDMDDSEIQRCSSFGADDNAVMPITKNHSAESSIFNNVHQDIDRASTSCPITVRQPTAIDVKKEMQSSSTTTHDSEENTVTIMKSSQRKIPCQNCGKPIQQRLMVAHMRIHTGEKPFKCRFCARHFNQHGTKSRHEKRIHKVQQTALSTPKSTKLLKNFLSRRNIMIEFQLTVFMCSYCTRVHNAAQDCLRHELEEHSPKGTSEAIDCVTNSEKDNKVADLIEPSTSSPPLSFTIADNDVKPDMRDSDIQRDSSLVTEHDRNQESSMAMDSSWTTTEESYIDRPSTSHLLDRRRLEDKPFNTSIKPPSATIYESKNDTASVKYPSQQKIPCEVCRKLVRKCHMAAHMRIHTGEKPFKCRFCLKAFSENITMIEFQLTIYMCSYCTRVHKAAHDCVRHEQEEHFGKSNLASEPVANNVNKVDNSTQQSSSSPTLPFTITTVDVKPDMDESDFAMQNEENEMFMGKETSIILDTTEKLPGQGTIKSESVRSPIHCEQSERHLEDISTTSPRDQLQQPTTVFSRRGRLTPNTALIPCRFCQRLIRKHNMPAHVRVHTGEQPFKCHFCPKKYKRNQQRYKHEEKVHKNVKTK